jgi:hypothetical protein
MSASYYFLTHSAQIDVRDIITVPEVLDAMRGIMQAPQAWEGMDLIFNLRHLNGEKIVTDKLRSGAEPIARLLPFFNNRLHLVVMTNLQFGLMRMFQAYSSNYGVEIIIHKSIEEAYKCLGEAYEQEPATRIA